MSGLDIQTFFDQEVNRVNHKFNHPDLFINRELSWMEFNKRVLHHAIRKDVPLLERLNFLGITASNLDEFIMVRLASIINKMRRGVLEPELSGLLPQQEYEAVFGEILAFKRLQEETYTNLLGKLKKNGIRFMKMKDLNPKQKEQVQKLFLRQIYPLLTPISLESTRDFPQVKSGQVSILACLNDPAHQNLTVVSIIPIDPGLKRIYVLTSSESDEHQLITLDEIVLHYLDHLFVNKVVVAKGMLRVLREADIEMDHNRDVYIIDRMRQALLKRELSQPIYMEIDHAIPKQVQKVIMRLFEIEKDRVYRTRHMVDLSVLKSFPVDIPSLRYESFRPQYPAELVGEHDVFTAIDSGDIVLHHPYESFDPVVNFLEHAAEDEHVLAIKQTLYRVSSADSPIVEALCRAAQLGKQVSVILEIKARFDENRNLSLIEKLRVAGCKLIYGMEELKTHCKFILVVRRTNKGLKTYCHIGTGNYNDKTSNGYVDISLLTSNTKIGDDLTMIANILTGYSEPKDKISKIFYAPYNIRDQMYKMIAQETENAKKGKRAFITLKLNSLSDMGIIKQLYQAADAGVKIAIFCRGICSMKPINKNIVIKSLVGRFLEHSRIYYFFNNGKTNLYISSADLLSRNLDRRVELMVPIVDDEARRKTLGILQSYFNDTSNTYVMNAEGRYETPKTLSPVNVQEFFMQTAIKNYKLHHVPKIPITQKKK